MVKLGPRAPGTRIKVPRQPDKPTPERYHRGNLKAVLMQVASELVEEKGPRNVSLREVARRAGVSQTAPYNHFADKEALLATVAAKGYEKMRVCLLRAAERRGARDPEAVLRAFARGYVDFAIEWPGHLHLIFGGVLKDLDATPELSAARQSAFAFVAENIARFMEEGNVGRGRMGPRTATVAAWALSHGLSLLLVDRRLDPADTEAGTQDELVDQITDVFIDALQPRKSD